jgi:23S rRNA pseudouridine1911/1915/1917 synthase
VPSPARRHRFVVAPAEAGLRLDQALAARVPELSRRKARALLDLGGVFVDGARVKVAGRTVRPGQEVVAVIGPAFERATKEVGREARGRDEAKLPAYRVVHTDEDLVVVDKPAGLLTAPTPESDRNNLARLVADQLRGPIFVVHRLDLGTSGLLVLARTELANRALSEVFRAHDVERAYLAALRGAAPWDERTVTEPVGGKPAETHIAVLERLGEAATFVRCALTTGRTHQIRLHARHVGHPVMGDTQHGEPSAHDPPRMALHAAVLGFSHPRTGEVMRFESAWPEELSAWMEGLRAGEAGV